MKVRYYGLLAGKGKKERIKRLKKLTNTAIKEIIKKTKLEILNQIIGKDVSKCECCGGELKLIQKLLRPPPKKLQLKECFG